jgi:hypothetical protein
MFTMLQAARSLSHRLAPKALGLCLTLSLLPACSSDTEESELLSIYGQDQRREIYEETDARIRNAARSVVAMIKKESLQGDRVVSESLGQKFRMCESERFREQATASGCSGFLIAPDIVATSGHCFKDQKDCESILMVFDYSYSQANIDPSRISSDRIYRCQKILDRAYGGADKKDYALIQLDRSVPQREPLRLQASGKVRDDAELIGIGTPTGLPLKIARGARVLKNTADSYFEATVDAFGGQSGGPVLNASTGLVEGILVRGRSDFNIDGPCTLSNTYSDTPDSAEDVTRASILATALAQKAPGQSGGGNQPSPPTNPPVQPWPPSFPFPTPVPGPIWPNPQPNPFPPTWPQPPQTGLSWATLISTLQDMARDAQTIQYNSNPEVSLEASRMQFLASQAALEAQRMQAFGGGSHDGSQKGYLQAQAFLLGSVYDLLAQASSRTQIREPAWSAFQRITAHMEWIRREAR